MAGIGGAGALVEMRVAENQTFTSPDGGVAAVERALALVAALEQADGPLSLADLSRTTGLYKSTILRLITSLEHNGYVARLRDGRYELGPTAFRLGVAYERKNALRAQVMPRLQELVDHDTESASFQIRQDPGHRLCLFRVNSHHETLDRIAPGGVYSVHAGAGGHVLVAFEGEPGPRYDAIRAEGWALSLGERDPACAALAAPVFGPAGLVGILSLSGPRERFHPERVAQMRATLLPIAAVLTHELGGVWPRFAPPASGAPADRSHGSRRRSAVTPEDKGDAVSPQLARRKPANREAGAIPTRRPKP